MVLYANGHVPLDVVSVVLGSGYDDKGRYWEWRMTPATFSRWQTSVNYAKAKWGIEMLIRQGANAYRNRYWQDVAREWACSLGNCAGAAYPGSSSHGGNWWYRGAQRDCLAIDVNPNGLSWTQVWEACTYGGFECGLITGAMSGFADGEPWHIVDFGAFGPVPAGGGSTPFPPPDSGTDPEPAPKPPATQGDDEDMLVIKNAKTGHVYAVGEGQITHLNSTARNVGINLYNKRGDKLIWKQADDLLADGTPNPDAGLIVLDESFFLAELDVNGIPRSKATEVLGYKTWTREDDVIAAISKPNSISEAEVKLIADAVVKSLPPEAQNEPIDYSRIVDEFAARLEKKV